MAKRRQSRTNHGDFSSSLPDEFRSSRAPAWSTPEHTIAWCLEHALLAPHPSWLDGGPYARRRVAFEAWAIANLPLVDDKPDTSSIAQLNIHGLLRETVRERMAAIHVRGILKLDR